MPAPRPPAGRLKGRTALITGASRGIGRAAAEGFAREGAQVVALGRTQGALEELDDAMKAEGLSVTLAPLDLLDPEAAAAAAKAVYERFGRLDALIANAGLLGSLGPVAQADGAEWAQVMELNVNANWRLIRAFDPLLRASDSGRAVFVTSGVTENPRPYWGVYAVSKTALEALAQIYAGETEKTNIRVNLLDPGRVRTGMRAEAYPGEDPETVKPPEAVVDAFVDLAAANCTRHGETVRLRP
ncbi:MAG: SDR family NAD(P)-dependent oxidoreductase [Rhodospirillales bacterium]